MNSISNRRSIGLWIAATIAIIFGMLTLKSGGSVLFIDGPAREQAGHYIPFILWFNFLSGFAYIIAGAGLIMQKAWAVKLALLIVLSTLIAFVILGVMIIQGVAFEPRTVAAMTLRSALWAIISFVAYRQVIKR